MHRGILLGLLVLAACPAASPPGPRTDAPDAGIPTSPLGGHYVDDLVVFRVVSSAATRIELSVFTEPMGAAATARVTMQRVDGTDVWAASVPRSDAPVVVYYGYRAWGPNWPYDPAWTPGSERGFVVDVDAEGNRFNPNKLLMDPYAREHSHDPVGLEHRDYSIYVTGPEHRARDSALVAPKAIVVTPSSPDVRPRISRALADEIIYEVHPRGFTRGAPSADPACAGTYAAAAVRAEYLADLGITAVELLPVHETSNDGNDITLDAADDNYWGYSTLGFFAPDRRYACDKSPGGPTREFRAMVDAMHARGIKVYLDVVYNHTAEGSTWDRDGLVAPLLSLRGLDNAAYYELTGDGKGYVNHTGVSHNTNVARRAMADLVVDSLTYWHRELGVDGFRFDLAAVLGNTCDRDCFSFSSAPDGLLARIATALDTADLIAEPWGVGGSTYQTGNFPAGWSEWNDHYRDLVRKDQNRGGIDDVTMGWLSARIAGSPELFGDDGRGPAASINYLASHDGMTLRDLYACNGKNNGQPWPYGPSDGGTNNDLAWDHGGDAAAQRQAARTGMALLLVSAGVPMIVGGDERLRSQRCNNNAYNLDSPAMWQDWSPGTDADRMAVFTRRLMQFRSAHPALRPRRYWSQQNIAWYRGDGEHADGRYMDDPAQHYLGWMIDGDTVGDPAHAVFVAYNGGSDMVPATLPSPRAGAAWFRVADTGAWLEEAGNAAAPGAEYQMRGARYDVTPRSLVVFVQRDAAPAE